MAKRLGGSSDLSMIFLNKKARTEIVLGSSREKSVVSVGTDRTSNLMSTIMLMEGHMGEIFTVAFHPEGQYFASAGFDRQIFLWNVYGECENIALMLGHSGAIMELHFSTDGTSIYTASTDQTLGIWDIESGLRVKRLKGHTSFVNSCHSARRGPVQIVSGSDDCSVKVWDPRKRGQCMTLNNIYQVTAVTFNDTAEQVISAGIDNDVKVWDLRKVAKVQDLKGHTDTVTGLSLSPDGSYLLSNSMDNTLRIWDLRPYASHDRCTRILTGHQHNFEKNLLRCRWSPDGCRIAAGSADRFLYVWDTALRKILYKLPGHNGSVNDVEFHPREPIVLSGSSDKQLFLKEIEP